MKPPARGRGAAGNGTALSPPPLVPQGPLLREEDEQIRTLAGRKRGATPNLAVLPDKYLPGLAWQQSALARGASCARPGTAGCCGFAAAPVGAGGGCAQPAVLQLQLGPGCELQKQTEGPGGSLGCSLHPGPRAKEMWSLLVFFLRGGGKKKHTGKCWVKSALPCWEPPRAARAARAFGTRGASLCPGAVLLCLAVKPRPLAGAVSAARQLGGAVQHVQPEEARLQEPQPDLLGWNAAL